MKSDPALFFSLLIITVSFLPVFTLQAQEGRLFSPLAFTKTYAMAGAALLAITLVPVLMGYLIRGRLRPEASNPINRALHRLHEPALRLAMRRRGATLVVAAILLGATVWPLTQLGSEFMPPLDEGDILYMPTTFPGISITKAKELLQQTDKMLKTFPEVRSVFGKVGRAETATDPAPLSMIETTVRLKPRADWPDPDKTTQQLMREMDRAIKFPGVANAWTMPIKTRIDMLSTGIKTPVGIKISGPDLAELQRIGLQIEARAEDAAGHAVGLRRPFGRRLLPRLRHRPRTGLALRADGRRRAGRDPVRDRRHERHADGRRARALPGQPALPARAARQSAGARARVDHDAGRRADPAGAGRQAVAAARLAVDQERRTRVRTPGSTSTSAAPTSVATLRARAS